MECGACMLNCPTGALFVDSGVGCAAAMINAALRGLKEPTCGGSEPACGGGSEPACGGGSQGNGAVFPGSLALRMQRQRWEMHG